jgi:hypothetical protein
MTTFGSTSRTIIFTFKKIQYVQPIRHIIRNPLHMKLHLEEIEELISLSKAD